MRENSDLFRQSSSEMIALHLEVVAGLQIQPEPITRAEISREPQGAIRADAPGAMHDLVDPSRGHTDIPGQSVLGQAQRLEEIRREHFAGMYGIQLSSSHAKSSSNVLVIVHDLNVGAKPRRREAEAIPAAGALRAFVSFSDSLVRGVGRDMSKSAASTCTE
jgi:hypothetical protein